MDTQCFNEFLKIAEALNVHNIVPVLMGSIGLEYVTQKEWHPSDIDIHVEGDPRGWDAPDELRIYQFELIYDVMKSLGYQLIDRHEHEFQKNDFSAEYGTINTLPEFACVEIEQLTLVNHNGVQFYVPTLEQFLKIYQASVKDSYRNDQNNFKDVAKIDYLKTILNNKNP